MQLIATIIHWDKFSVGSAPFYVWFASYLLPPPIFIGAYLWHQHKSTAGPVTSSDTLPLWLHRLFIILGISLTLGSIFIFIFPGLIIPTFPWKLTPLTARSLSGWLIVIGTMLLFISRENNRTRARLATPMLILVLPALLMQMLRYANEVNWINPILWIGLILFAVIGFCGVYLANGNWRDALN